MVRHHTPINDNDKGAWRIREDALWTIRDLQGVEVPEDRSSAYALTCGSR